MDQGTSGTLFIEAGDDELVAALNNAGLEIEACADMRGILWGKLLVNLNNSVIGQGARQSAPPSLDSS